MKFTVTVEPDDIPIRGNVMASGDEAVDRAAENAVLEQLREGNVWAWCRVCVSAPCPCCGAPVSEYLSGCSYRDEADFREPGGYFDDMCNEVRARIESGEV